MVWSASFEDKNKNLELMVILCEGNKNKKLDNLY